MIGPRRSAVRPWGEKAAPVAMVTSTSSSSRKPSSTAETRTDLDSGGRRESKHDKNESSKDAPVIEDNDHRTKKRRKEFAWMDSGDEESGEDGDKDEKESSPKQSDAEDSEKELPVPTSVDEVQSFSEMLRMAPSLTEKVKDMQPEEVTAVCSAVARVRFYDGGLMQALTSRIRRLITTRATGGLSPGMLVTILGCLADMNTYDKEVFVPAVSVLAAPGVAERLDAVGRRRLLDCLKAVKHAGAEGFIDTLTERVANERYETAKDELMKRNLQRMYGASMDLQGASEDVQRALLKPRFHQKETLLSYKADGRPPRR